MMNLPAEQPARRKTSVVQIAENEVMQFPSRRMSKSGMSDTGSSIYSMRRSIVAKPKIELVGCLVS